ncbi:sensor histidine kinase [Pedobacter sp. HMF7056]|uniref:Sensor histidine kinase n=2 Tax=Hufsiella ginkgonis TaxID=2695274 RepID=A0A7K1XWE0_9SPHI|nr:sensor histidine kinase [Hufsiella ginkgonis]
MVRYTVLYASFVLLILNITPALLSRRNVALNVIFCLFLFVGLGLIFAVTDTWLRGYVVVDHPDLDAFYGQVFKENMIYGFWLMMMFVFYTAIKYAASYILLNTNKIAPKYQAISRECAVALVIWMIIMLMMMGGNAPKEAIGLVGLIAPFAIGLYWYSIYDFIPRVLAAKQKFGAYLRLVALSVAAGTLPISFIVLIIYYSWDAGLIINLFNAGFQLLITAPLAWQVYKRRESMNTELHQLKTDLGRSEAGLDFLRSQINPHFLFNSLNTLYGTALQENSERTANGIQKLGDMMRFMIHENHQDKIVLARELDYLRNYIDLQLLRTQESPDIRVDVNIEEALIDKRIAPMLLIPFIENAFKHGISLSKPSWIRITLNTNENELYFDVYNSIHPRSGDDPEKDHSGIGLNNVKQRLALLYPDKHKLIIRETAREFFIHLTVQY